MPEPKIIEGKARRRPPLSKPLAFVYIALCGGCIAWMFMTPPYTLGHMGFVAVMAAAASAIISELVRNID